MNENLFFIFTRLSERIHFASKHSRSLRARKIRQLAKRLCQNSRLIFPHIYFLRLSFLHLLFKIVHSRVRPIFGSPHAQRHVAPPFRGGKDRGDKNRISLLFRLDTCVCVHMRCPGPATSSRLRPRDILSRARRYYKRYCKCMLVRL